MSSIPGTAESAKLSAFALAEQMAGLLSGHSKALQKEALGLYLSTLGLRAIPFGVAAAPRERQAEIPKPKAAIAAKAKDAPQVAPHKADPKWVEMQAERDSVVAKLKAASTQDEKSGLTASLRQIEATMKSFKACFPKGK